MMTQMLQMQQQDRICNEVQQLIYSLGVSGNYKGFCQTTYAVVLAVQDPQYLLSVTKKLYPDVAKYFGTTWTAVERNIRTIVAIAWETDSERLSAIAGYSLSQKPNVAQFLSILTFYVSSHI